MTLNLRVCTHLGPLGTTWYRLSTTWSELKLAGKHEARREERAVYRPPTRTGDKGGAAAQQVPILSGHIINRANCPPLCLLWTLCTISIVSFPFLLQRPATAQAARVESAVNSANTSQTARGSSASEFEAFDAERGKKRGGKGKGQGNGGQSTKPA